MLSFQKYGVRVDQQMERQKRRSSSKNANAKPVPSIVVEKLDSTTGSTSLNSSQKSSAETIKIVGAIEQINNSQEKIKRSVTIDEEDLLLDNSGSDGSSDESD